MDFNKKDDSKQKIVSARHGELKRDAYINIIHPSSKVILTNKMNKEMKSKLKEDLFNRVKNKVKFRESKGKRENFKKFYSLGPAKHTNRKYKPYI